MKNSSICQRSLYTAAMAMGQDLMTAGLSYWQHRDAYNANLAAMGGARLTRSPSVLLANSIECSYLFGVAPLAVTGSADLAGENIDRRQCENNRNHGLTSIDKDECHGYSDASDFLSGDSRE